MRSFMACLEYWVELVIRRRKKRRETGSTSPMPKLTLQTPAPKLCWYAARTISTTIPAATKPASTAKQVVMADNMPRLPRTPSLSFVASVVVVAQVGYSPTLLISGTSMRFLESSANLQHQTLLRLFL